MTSQPDSSPRDGVKPLLGHRNVAVSVLQVEQLVIDDGRVEALLSQLHLLLLESLSH